MTKLTIEIQHIFAKTGNASKKCFFPLIIDCFVSYSHLLILLLDHNW